MSARGKKKQPAAAAAGADDYEDYDEEEEDRIQITSKDVMQTVKRLKNDSSLTSISKQSLGLDTPEEEEKMFETLKKSPFLTYDAEEDRIKLNASMCAVNTQNVKEKIEEFRNGVSWEDLAEYDSNLNAPIREHLRNASLFALKGWRDSNKHVRMLYPRGTDFLVPLSGTFRVSANRNFLECTADLRNEVRRGDSLVIEGKAYRVSCETRTLETMSERDLKDYIKCFTGQEETEQERDMLIRRAHALTQTEKPKNPIAISTSAGTDLSALEKLAAPFSSSSLADPKDPPSTQRAVPYKLDFTDKLLPIDPPYRGPSAGVEIAAVHKHGMTNDVRRVYWQVAGKVSSNFKNTKDGAEKLNQMILSAGLMKKTLLDGINHNVKELRENTDKRVLEKQNQKGGRKRRA